jgi:dienelactone hydrolase
MFISCRNFFLKFAVTFLLSTLTAVAQTNVQFKSQACISEKAFLDNCKPLSVSGGLYEASKDAIVFITHGSQGVDERHHRYAKYLQSLGISALVIDHWKARGVWDVQRDFVHFAKRGANSHNMVIDIQHAIEHFRDLGYKKTGFIGESMGGGVAVLLAKNEWQHHFSRVSGKKPNQLDAIVGLYGSCNERYSYDSYLNSPMLIITGELDADAPSKTCRDYVDEWANRRGARIAFIELPGQHHDFDAGFSLMKSKGAQNPSRCISQVDLRNITATLTGKTYPNTPAGWNEWRSTCILKAYENPARYGNTGDPNTGFKEWGRFFVQELL